MAPGAVVMLGAASLVLALTATVAVALWRGTRRLLSLTDAALPPSPPRVSIIVAARDEAEGIQRATESLLCQQGLAGDAEVIVVNDRSGDGTGAILHRLEQRRERLRVLTLADLPAGWLGKNHALWRGAAIASGDWLLFTDADVVMAPQAVARAVGHAERLGLDHVTAMPEIEARSPWLRVLILQFAISFLGYFRPWRLDRDPRAFAGVGAFNLVRADRYRAVDGHRAIALTPLDDMLLARRLRRAGARSRALNGQGALSVPWYPNARAMIAAFDKNAFAAFDYRIWKLAALTALVAAVGLGPWLGLFAPDPAVRLVCAASVAVSLWLHGWLAQRSGWPRATALLAPVGTVLTLWLWWRGSVRTLWRGAIEWRGTRYPLSALRAAHDRIMRDDPP